MPSTLTSETYEKIRQERMALNQRIAQVNLDIQARQAEIQALRDTKTILRQERVLYRDVVSDVVAAYELDHGIAAPDYSDPD